MLVVPPPVSFNRTTAPCVINRLVGSIPIWMLSMIASDMPLRVCACIILLFCAYLKQESGESLSLEEEYLLDQAANATLRLWENTHYQYRMGLFDEDEFEADLAVWRDAMRSPEYKKHWITHHRLVLLSENSPCDIHVSRLVQLIASLRLGSPKADILGIQKYFRLVPKADPQLVLS